MIIAKIQLLSTACCRRRRPWLYNSRVSTRRLSLLMLYPCIRTVAARLSRCLSGCFHGMLTMPVLSGLLRMRVVTAIYLHQRTNKPRIQWCPPCRSLVTSLTCARTSSFRASAPLQTSPLHQTRENPGTSTTCCKISKLMDPSSPAWVASSQSNTI